MPGGTDGTERQVDHSDPWMEDGNVIINAQGKYFRVHYSVLKAQSEVFRDMFACSHISESEQELIEQCPVIQLHDSASDVQILLNAMYDRSYPVPYYEKTPFPVVSAFLRLGEKYGVSVLVKEAKVKLRCVLEPTTIPNFSKPLTEAHTQLFPAITDTDPYNIQIMNLLQEMNLKASLPLAMYHCIIFCPLINIVECCKFNDSVCWLSPPNLRSFIHIKDVLEKFRAELAKGLGGQPGGSPWCSPTSCTHNERRTWLDDILFMQPFNPWKSEWDKQFCLGCRRYWKGRREEAAIRVWNQLPTAFGFDSWAKVRESDDFLSLTRTS